MSLLDECSIMVEEKDSMTMKVMTKKTQLTTHCRIEAIVED